MMYSHGGFGVITDYVYKCDYEYHLDLVFKDDLTHY